MALSRVCFKGHSSWYSGVFPSFGLVNCFAPICKYTCNARHVRHVKANLSIGLDEIQCVVTTCWFVKGENSAGMILWNIHLTPSSEPICFKHSMMLNTTKLYSLIPVWMTLMLTQGHRVTGKVELVQSFCRTVAWSNSNVHDDWLREMAVKESCQYRKYISIDCVSICSSCFLFVCLFVSCVSVVHAFVSALNRKRMTVHEALEHAWLKVCSLLSE